MTVHNHGPSQGAGLDCPERIVNGVLKGACMTAQTRLATTVRINRAASGRSTADIECPFCHCVTQVYVWSLAGSGKRCDCGALLHGDGIGSTAATKSTDTEES